MSAPIQPEPGFRRVVLTGMLRRMWITVRNASGTAKATCSCEAWLRHWKKFHPDGDRIPLLCSVMGCMNPAEDGGHVYIVGDPMRGATNPSGSKFSHSDALAEALGPYHIVPLCKECNRRDDAFTLDRSDLVADNACKRTDPVAR